MADEKPEEVAEKRGPLTKLTKNSRITIAVVAVAVVAVVAAGAFTWAASPGFCNALCHSPLDNYVEGYGSDDPSLGVTVHAAAGVDCLTCHDRSAVRQLGEFAHWATDSYEVDADGFLVKDDDLATKEFCTQAGCHTWDAIVDSTWGFAGNDEEFNPHASHQDGSIVCSDCHKMHRANELYCAKCHDLELPEGWVATSE